MKKDLQTAQTELTSGRYADVGLQLGAGTVQSVSLRTSANSLQAMQSENNVVSTRLSLTQNVLTSLISSAQSLMQNIAGSTGNGAAASFAPVAQQNLQDMANQLNTSQDGSYIFAGINSGVAPMTAYTSTSTAKANMDASFSAAFGMSQTSTSVSTISASDMQAYLDGPFAALNQGTGWSDTSSASSTVLQTQIGPSETRNTSVSTNDTAFQKLATAYTMVAELGNSSFNGATAQAISASAIKALSSAIAGLQSVATNVGSVQGAISTSNDNMTAQANILNTQIGNLENVDPYAAQTRVSQLTTQIQAAYSLTAQTGALMYRHSYENVMDDSGER
eukprot:gene13682-13798_t